MSASVLADPAMRANAFPGQLIELLGDVIEQFGFPRPD
jgi:hypothetical protein